MSDTKSIFKVVVMVGFQKQEAAAKKTAQKQHVKTHFPWDSPWALDSALKSPVPRGAAPIKDSGYSAKRH
jgi:hypothetical protein